MIVLLKVFFNKKVASVLFALTIMVALSSGAFANVTLVLWANSEDITLDNLQAKGVTLRLQKATFATPTATAVTWVDMSSVAVTDNPVYGKTLNYNINEAGTYRYSVRSETANYYNVDKVIYITPSQISNDNTVHTQVFTALTETGKHGEPMFEWGVEGNWGYFDEPRGTAVYQMYNDQVIQAQFNTDVALRVFPDGLGTPVFNKTYWHNGKEYPRGMHQLSTHDDMMKFLREEIVAKSGGIAHLFVLGRSVGFNLEWPVVVVTKNPGISSSLSIERAGKILQESNRARYMHQGQIDGLEGESGEGTLVMLKWLITAPEASSLLNDVDVIVVPRINVDGAKMQDENSFYNLDMNRDHLRLKAQENRDLHRTYLAFMPHVVMDGHATQYHAFRAHASSNSLPRNGNGWGISIERTTDIESTPSSSMLNPSMELNNLAMDVYAKNIHAHLKDVGLRSDNYQNGNPGWTTNSAIGRAYYGLMGSLSFLAESRRGASFEIQRRAFGQAEVSKTLLRTLAANKAQTIALVKAAHEKVVARGKVFIPYVESDGKEIAIANMQIPLDQFASGLEPNQTTGVQTPGSKYSNFKTARYVFDMEGNVVYGLEKTLAINDDSRRWRARPTAYIVPKGLGKLDSNFGGTQSGHLNVDASSGYRINYDYLVEMLKLHNIEFYEISAGYKANVKQYYRNNDTNTTNTAMLAGLRDEAEVIFENGAYVIPLDQIAAAVVIAIFEPDMTASNNFNASVAQTNTNSADGTVKNGLAVITHDVTTRNYPYYRLEKSNPRDVLKDKNACKEEVKKTIRDILEENGCNVGFGFIAFLFLIAVPFMRKK